MAYPLIDTNVGNKIIANHRILDAGGSETGNLYSPNEEIKYYEVIRCIDGIPLFMEDHLDRLQASIQDSITWDRSLMQKEVRMLAGINGMKNGNIKIVLTKTMQLLFAGQFYYPAKKEYASGVRAGLLQWQRQDPNVKMVREDYKSAVAKKLLQEGPFGPYFEILLVDDNGFVTEGSRSNVFFVKEQQVFTAPDEDILKGITRKYVLEAIQTAGAVLVTKKLSVQKITALKENGAAFLSGTSIRVLPICAIEDTMISSSKDKMVLQIMKEYDIIIRNYLNLHKNVE